MNSSGFFALVIFGLGAFYPVKADEPITPELYKAEVIVTGVEEPERTRGFRDGLTEIIVKLTGRPELEGSKVLEPFMASPAAFIESFTYEDRKKGIPVHDEQGTRERSFFLRMNGNVGKLEEALNKAGVQFWRHRPDFEVLLTVQDPRGDYLIADEVPAPLEPTPTAELGSRTYRIATARYDGYGPREVLKSIARHRGLHLILPNAGKTDERRQQPWALPDLFKPVDAHANTIRYRAKIIPLPSGYWRVETHAWALSQDGSYADLPDCLPFQRSEVTFDVGLKASLDALSASVRDHNNTVFCGSGKRL